MRIQKQELLDAIDELEHGRHTIQTCENLAACYTVLDHMYPEEQPENRISYMRGYSGSAYQSSDIGLYGDTEFLKAIEGKDSEKTWKLMDEAMTILAMTNKRLYEHIMSRI